MQFLFEQRLDNTSPGSQFAIAAMRANASALNSQGLVHDRASSSNELQVGNGAATRRLVGGGREGAQSCGRGLLQEGTDALGLAKESLHFSSVSIAKLRRVSECRRMCVEWKGEGIEQRNWNLVEESGCGNVNVYACNNRGVRSIRIVRIFRCGQYYAPKRSRGLLWWPGANIQARHPRVISDAQATGDSSGWYCHCSYWSPLA